mmetsp:Transcript_102501/g.289507  ORF Transcript_102501/g.289507 Transcript_102501/m.289507 type:complete len:97 (+) Transcript_102501:19-309(+)
MVGLMVVHLVAKWVVKLAVLTVEMMAVLLAALWGDLKVGQRVVKMAVEMVDQKVHMLVDRSAELMDTMMAERSVDLMAVKLVAGLELLRVVMSVVR